MELSYLVTPSLLVAISNGKDRHHLLSGTDISSQHDELTLTLCLTPSLLSSYCQVLLEEPSFVLAIKVLEGSMMAFKRILLSRKFLLAASEEGENGINKALAWETVFPPCEFSSRLPMPPVPPACE
ncbi:hypothetical protein P7K49_016561 [Saguinus oedipus]|uniref:Uncharacterized protein n=1 Tax=Saguinus oedipus TaxID=9490 RepID=A0ABQ9VFC3_SAGOE|nr:hypothetical protein P7K49_016561 [Saguinus oedipus]